MIYKKNNLISALSFVCLTIVGIFTASAVFATLGDLTVNFQTGPNTPLFNEANFLPGETVTRWVEVTNNSSETRTIGIKATDNSSCLQDCLSDQLKLKISDGSSNLYEAFLTDFFTAGEKKLSELGAGETKIYYFNVTFLSTAGNNYQDKEVSFNFDIGMFGQETIGDGGDTGGGTGDDGGHFGEDIGLIITNENYLFIGDGQVNIIWNTNRDATSRVIYASQYESHAFQLENPPNYGYARSTAEFNTPPTINGVINHSVILTGLVSGVTYYYRTVSRGSFAISKEQSFTMPGETTEYFSEEESERIAKRERDEEIIWDKEERSEGREIEEKEEEEGEEETKEKKNLGSLFLASLGGLFGGGANLCLTLFLLVTIITILLLTLLERKKEDKNNLKKRWILTIGGIIAMIVLYVFICPDYYKLLLIVETVIFIIFLIFYYFVGKKKR